MKLSLIIIFLFCLTINSQAQDQLTLDYPTKGDKFYGLSIGSFKSSITGDNLVNIENIGALSNYGASFVFERFKSKNWSFKTGVTYDRKGWQSIAGFSRTRINYLTVPILTTWHFGKKRRLYIHFGPYAGYLLSANVYSGLSSNSEPISFTGNFKTFDFGLDLGIGLRIPIAGQMFYIETDGQIGLFNPLRNSDDENYYLTRNRLSIGYMF